MGVPVPLRQALSLPSHVSLSSDTFKGSLGKGCSGLHNRRYKGRSSGFWNILEHWTSSVSAFRALVGQFC